MKFNYSPLPELSDRQEIEKSLKSESIEELFINLNQAFQSINSIHKHFSPEFRNYFDAMVATSP